VNQDLTNYNQEQQQVNLQGICYRFLSLVSILSQESVAVYVSGVGFNLISSAATGNLPCTRFLC
jgi:hypothetical protein